MFKKKPIYIVGIILFTLLLLADLALFFLVPAEGGMGGVMEPGFTMPGNNSGFGDRQPSASEDEASSFGSQQPATGEDEASSFGNQRPATGEDEASSFGSQRPDASGDAGGSFGGRQPGQMPDGDNSFTMPQGMEAETQQLGQVQQMFALLQSLRGAFWPILIVSLLGDGLCIFMLVRISRRQKQEQEQELIFDDDDTRHDHTNVYLAIVALVLVAAVVITGLPRQQMVSDREAQGSIRQETAVLGDMVSYFSGSGTLESSETVEKSLPAGVIISSYAVKNGDTVAAGDALARVDKTSVQKAIFDLQTLMDELDEELAELSATGEVSVTAPAEGRVKAIYAAAGETAAEVMEADGALVLISLGGSMTVEIESEASVSVGQSLTVTLSDGTVLEGKVQQVRDNRITITTTDDGPTPGDTVTVATGEGTQLGTGSLEIASPLRVTAISGTVKAVKVAVGDEVKSGATLLTLTDHEDYARYRQLLAQRQELAALVEELSVIAQDGVVRAEHSGIVSGLREDIEYTPLAVTGGYTIQLLSHTEAAPPTGEDGMTPPQDEPPSQEQANGVFVGVISQVSYGAFRIKISETDMAGVPLAFLSTLDETLLTTEKEFSPALDIPVNQYQDGQTLPSSLQALKAGDKVLLTVVGGVVSQIDYVAGVTTPSQGMGGIGGGSTGGASSGTGGSFQMPSMSGGSNQQFATQEEEVASYEVEMTTLWAITPVETMTVAVTVDELDILSLTPGMAASVTLDALPGQQFQGEVEKIHPQGTNSGGSTKYTVTVSLPRNEKMLPGMNVSVSVEVSRMEQVLTVPAAAICEEGNRIYVYTALDPETGELTGAVEVTTGASDGESIQILSGLSEGDTVCYHYADSIVYRSQ